MFKFIVSVLVIALLSKEASAACSSANLTKVESCYTKTFTTINSDSKDYGSLTGIYHAAFSMWEGYSAICDVHNDLIKCIKDNNVEGCVNPDDMKNVPFIKVPGINSNSTARSYVLDYIKFDYLCSQLNNTDRDTYVCFRDNIASDNHENCTKANTGGFNLENNCFIQKIWNTCIRDYASARCGPQTECMAQKLFALDMCYKFGPTNQCGFCNSFSATTNHLDDLCTEVPENGSSFPSLSFTFIFIATFIFQFFQ